MSSRSSRRWTAPQLVYDASAGTLSTRRSSTATTTTTTASPTQGEVLIPGIFDLKFRDARPHHERQPAGDRRGFLYIAVGDYGFGGRQDGAAVQLHGGSPGSAEDGTGLEVLRGQRGGCCRRRDRPVPEHLRLRDNTNDDWRLGRPAQPRDPDCEHGLSVARCTNFNDEIVQPLADYGGGSPAARWPPGAPVSPRVRRHVLHLRVGPEHDLPAPTATEPTSRPTRSRSSRCPGRPIWTSTARDGSSSSWKDGGGFTVLGAERRVCDPGHAAGL